jgi:hypothetical protein
MIASVLALHVAIPLSGCEFSREYDFIEIPLTVPLDTGSLDGTSHIMTVRSGVFEMHCPKSVGKLNPYQRTQTGAGTVCHGVPVI